MNNNLNVWFRPENLNEAIANLTDVLESGFINDGPKTRQFEEQISELSDRKFGVAVPNATLGIMLSLLAIKNVEKPQVIVPSFSFIATANAIVHAGLQPKFIDVDNERFLIDCEQLENELSTNKKVCAVVAVEVNGRSPDYGQIEQLCKQYGVLLITDSAEALGSKHNHTPLGKFGVASIYSFSPNKIITSGQGGIVVCDSEEMYIKLMELKLQGNSIRGDGGADTFHKIGLNLKFTDLQASVALSQLNRLEERINHSSWLRQKYISTFATHGLVDEFHLSFPPTNENECLLWFDVISQRPKEFQDYLVTKNIGFRNFWPPMPTQESYNYNSSEFPVASDISAKGFWLASNFSISDNDFTEMF